VAVCHKEDASRTSEEALAALRELFEQGLSDAEIAAELNRRRLPSGHGQSWVKGGVYDGAVGSVQYDDMVVATERVGCLR